ncbi:hypothetical protein [Euzebya tangerina]|uniref:hypothetical protein n=1 Tax=Euzebya tangerina TaxID=591198 RepID=UPI000E311BCD|nr:hypothetical protein [Euzebya tangerina]
MATATLEIYRTESGSVYEVADGRVRRAATSRIGEVDQWQPYVAINRIPAALFTPGTAGEVLEILLESGQRIYTSRLIPPG